MLETFWRNAILENIPHGEDGSLQLQPVDAIALAQILLKNGYAVCLTGGDIGDDIKVSWCYAGDSSDIDYANYDNIVFTSADYIEDYPAAYYEQYTREDQLEDIGGCEIDD